MDFLSNEILEQLRASFHFVFLMGGACMGWLFYIENSVDRLLSLGIVLFIFSVWILSNILLVKRGVQ